MTRTAFLIEDDYRLGESILELLKLNNFEVFWFVSGIKALEKINEVIPDVIICDLMLPGLSGHDFFLRLRKKPQFSTVPVIMITANVDPEVKLLQLKSGVNDFLIKPFRFKELLFKVQNIIAFRENILKNEKTISKINHYKIDTSSFVDKLDEILYDNLNNNLLSLDFVATKLHISRSTLDKKIRATSHTNFSNYLKSFKLNYSKKIIDLGAYNIKEISTVSGFNSVSYFSTNFKSFFGISPGKYIKMYYKSK
jgi:DNA-binding response OmpR family regulator